jgi:hypothetical protein
MTSPGLRKIGHHLIVSAGGSRGPVLSLSELLKASVTARVYAALRHGNKTLQEIERWGRFNGDTERQRQQTVCGILGRLAALGFVERCSYERPDGVRGMPCTVWRITGKQHARDLD